MRAHLSDLEAPWPGPSDPSVLEDIRSLLSDRSVVVADDDPTGTQTVSRGMVLTSWTAPELIDVLREGHSPIFVSTNSRSLSPSDAARDANELGQAIRLAQADTNRDVVLISRSDSTLRGHFPGEVDALARGYGTDDFRVVLAPYFGEGGRITVAGVQFIVDGDGKTIPVAETSFANDPAFSYRHSDLVEWTKARCGAEDRAVISVPLDAIRERGASAVSEALQTLPPRGVCVVDSAAERDVEIVALGVLQALELGIPVVPRTAASFVRACIGESYQSAQRTVGGIPQRPGLVLVGSHVPLTSLQLSRLLDSDLALTPLELDVRAVVDSPSLPEPLIDKLVALTDDSLSRGVTAVVFTSRDVVSQGQASVAVASSVSQAMAEIPRRLRSRPGWVLAKGGITSSDVATHGLGVRRARVMGRLQKGIAVWRTGDESKWPHLAYVVFPGNVGGADALYHAVRSLHMSDRCDPAIGHDDGPGHEARFV